MPMTKILRKTFVLDEKLEGRIMNIEAGLIKETHHHWSDSKVINTLIQYAIQKGATAHTIAIIFDKK
jgi:hypothetical protein